MSDGGGRFTPVAVPSVQQRLRKDQRPEEGRPEHSPLPRHGDLMVALTGSHASARRRLRATGIEPTTGWQHEP